MRRGLSGGRGRGLSSSEPGLRDTRTGSGREAKGYVRTENDREQMGMGAPTHADIRIHARGVGDVASRRQAQTRGPGQPERKYPGT